MAISRDIAEQPLFRSLLKCFVYKRNWHCNYKTINSLNIINTILYYEMLRFQWPRGLRRGSAAARLLRSWVRIALGGWMFVCCECCVLSGRGFCDGLIILPEESCRLWCVVVCDLETSWIRRPWPTGGCRAKHKQTKHYNMFVIQKESIKIPCH
jgi:hypothetical protein